MDQAPLTASTKIALEPLQKFPADSLPPGEFQKQPLVGDTVESLCEIQMHNVPRVTFFMNLKEHNQEFLLTGQMVWRSERAVEVEARSTLY